MRIRVLSDLHLEDSPWEAPAAEADVVVLAGDIANGAAGVEWAKRSFDVPVLFVAGNHEPFDSAFHETAAAIREAAAGSNVTVLDRDERVIAGVRFLGATLWSDFELDGPAARERALAELPRIAPDFRVVRFGDGLFTAQDWIALHRADRAWLEARLAAPFAGPTVVVTHFLPHPQSIAPRFAGHPFNPGFATDLSHLMGRAALWMHGHTHTALDYVVGGTRIVCNPRGYPHERTGFRPDLVVEV
ncbi:MAG: metallophosphoesterase family protein [Burkholderiales bacterium]|nr:metallophosphoesterase family protein [Burkholderiales bacterium]